MDNLNKALENAVDSLEDVIKGITRKENITPADLEHLSKSICTIERIRNIQREEGTEGTEEGYSGNSYRRGRNHYNGQFMSRDSSNNYHGYHDGGSNASSRAYDGGGNSARRYFDSEGYSGHSIKDRMVSKLEEMFDEAKNEHERQTVQKWIDMLERKMIYAE